MSLVKWEPMHERARMRHEMDRVFGRMAGEAFGDKADMESVICKWTRRS